MQWGFDFSALEFGYVLNEFTCVVGFEERQLEGAGTF